MRWTSGVAVVLLGFQVGLAWAGAVAETQRFNLTAVPPLAAPPQVDGVVDKREWSGASLLPRLLLAGAGVATESRSRIYLGYDATALYIAFQFDRPANALAPQADDVVELFLDPTHEHRRAIAFTGNVSGRVAGADWSFQARATGFGWEGELAIPFAALCRSVPPDGEVWGFDLIHQQATPVEQRAGYSFANQPGHAADFSHIVFVKEGPPVRFEQFGPFTDEQGGGAVLELVNTADAPVELAVTLDVRQRQPTAKGGFLPAVVGGLQAGADIVLATPEELIKEELAKYTLVAGATTNASLSVPGNRRTEVRVVTSAAGNYLLQYRVARGAQVIASGVLPYVLAPPVLLTLTHYHLSPGILRVQADLRHMPEWGAGAQARFAIVKTAGGQPVTEVIQEFTPQRQLDIALPTRALAPGGYLLTVELTGADGKKVGSLSEAFTKPAIPEWFTNPVGLEPVIPPPWQPIQTRGQTVAFLMGTYALADFGLPAQVNVRSIYDEQRVPLLSEPVRLRGRVNRQEIQWKKSQTNITSQKPELVTVTGAAAFQGLTVKAHTEFEYDGMAKVTLKLGRANDQPVAVEQLWVEFPLTKEVATLYQRSPTLTVMKDFLVAGEVPAAGLRHEFVHSVWLGNEERGLRWFSENMKGWHIATNYLDRAIEIVADARGPVLRVHLIRADTPLRITAEREIVFGYMFTPARTINAKLLNHGLIHERLAATGGSHMNNGELWFFPLQGWPIVPPGKLAEMRAFMQLAHQRGITVTPYSGWMLPAESDAAKVFGDELIAQPLRGMGCGCNVCCWNTAMPDVYTALLADRIRDLEIDGFRLDAGFSAESCQDRQHTGGGSTCGWMDDAGKLQASRGLFAARRAAQRAYRIFHGGVKKTGGVCIQHVHQGNRYDLILDHMDAVLSAEGGETKMQSLREFPLAFFRANVMGDQHGWQVIYMPKTSVIGYDARFGLALLHNLSPRGTHLVMDAAECSYSRSASVPTAVWAAREWIAPFTPGTELWGYWKNSRYLQTGHADVVGTFQVQRGKKLLLSLLNLGRQPVATTVQLDLPALGFTGAVYAYDSLARTAVPVAAGKLALTVAGEGFRMLMLAAAPFDYFVPEPTGENLLPDQWPAGWEATTLIGDKVLGKPATENLRSENGAIVFEGDGSFDVRLRKKLPVVKGRSYLLEAEAEVQCADGAYLGTNPEVNYFRLLLGEPYHADIRTLTSQTLPGQVEKIQLWFTVKDYAFVELWLRQSRGQVRIQKLAVRELQNTPRRPWEVKDAR